MSDKLPDRELRRVTKALRSVRRIRPDRQRARQAVAKALAAVGQEPQAKSSRQRRMKWLTWPGAMAAAAALVAVALIGVGGLLSGRPAAGATFSDVIRKIRQVTTVRYSENVFEGGRALGTTQVSVSQAGMHFRRDDEDMTVISDFSARKSVLYTKGAELTATPFEIPEGIPPPDMIRILSRLPESAGKDCGFEELSGVRVQVFEAASKAQVMRLWVDANTGLPLRVRMTSAASAASQSELILDKFEWNCVLPGSLFSLTPPAGYKWAAERVSSATEQDLLTMLKTWAHLNAGRFPEAIDRLAMTRFIDAEEKKAGKMKRFSLGETQMVVTEHDATWEDFLNKARLGRRFATKMKDADWWYQGGGVELGDGSTAICWWRQDDAYRVVYGDLTIKTLPPADLPPRRLPARSAPATRHVN
jgi:outer membrane lipoprotein-sorting protein